MLCFLKREEGGNECLCCFVVLHAAVKNCFSVAGVAFWIACVVGLEQKGGRQELAQHCPFVAASAFLPCCVAPNNLPFLFIWFLFSALPARRLCRAASRLPLSANIAAGLQSFQAVEICL